MNTSAVAGRPSSGATLSGRCLAGLDRWRRWSAEGRASTPPAPLGLVQLLLLAALWIAGHPYVGIEHDARYYMLQAIRANDPQRFAGDLYFKYGSQDNFTLFTALYAPMVARLGPGLAHLLFFAGEQALWFAALIWLSRRLFDRATWLPATVAMILCDAHYSSQHIFQYGEFFVTSRPPAEAFVVCALACLLSRRIVLGLAFIALAGLLHPLMALAGAGVFVMMALLHWRSWVGRLWPLALAIGLAGVACLALRPGPFARLFATFDSHWFALVEQRSSYTFLAHWTPADWLQLATTIGILAFASFSAHPARRLLHAAALTALLALIADFALGDVGRNVLAVDAQLWRNTWLAALLANGFAGYLVVTMPRGAAARPIILTALVVSGMSRFVYLDAMTYAIPLAIGLSFLAYERIGGSALGKWGMSAARLTVASGIGWCLTMAGFYSANFGFAWLIAASIAGASLWLIWASVSNGRARQASALLAAVMPALAIATADLRDPWQKFVENGPPAADLQAFVGEKPGLYWEGDPSFVWIKLRRPTYYSCEQGTGLMFYRGTAFDFERKSGVLSRLNSMDFYSQPGSCFVKADAKASGPASGAVLAQVCRASPGLSEIVLEQPVPGVSGRIWKAPAAKAVVRGSKRVKTSNYYGYSCADLR